MEGDDRERLLRLAGEWRKVAAADLNREVVEQDPEGP